MLYLFSISPPNSRGESGSIIVTKGEGERELQVIRSRKSQHLGRHLPTKFLWNSFLCQFMKHSNAHPFETHIHKIFLESISEPLPKTSMLRTTLYPCYEPNIHKYHMLATWFSSFNFKLKSTRLQIKIFKHNELQCVNEFLQIYTLCSQASTFI